MFLSVEKFILSWLSWKNLSDNPRGWLGKSSFFTQVKPVQRRSWLSKGPLAESSVTVILSFSWDPSPLVFIFSLLYEQPLSILTVHSTASVICCSRDRLVSTVQQNILQYVLAGVVQVVGASSHKQKGHRFDSQSGHMPR